MPLHKYIYSSIYTNPRAEIFFVTWSFLFHTQNKIFHEVVIYLVLYRKVLQHKFYFPFLTNQY